MSIKSINDLLKDIQIWMNKTKREIAAKERAENLLR